MTKTLRFALAAPIALALASCGSGADETGEIAGEAIAAIPAPDGTEWRDMVTVTDMDGYMIGNPDAPIKLVEYASLTCPTCARFAEEGMEPLVSEYVNSGRVSFEFRSFVIHGPLDLALTRLVDCGTPEQAVPLADQVWANLPTIMQPLQERGPQLEAALNLPEDQRFVAFADTAGLLDFFAARGVSRDQARTCLADAGRLSEIADVSETYGTQDDITQTPTFVLNGKKLDDSSWTAIEAALQRAGAR